MPKKLCPYCSQEMEPGYIYNGKDDIVWTPKDSDPSGFINFPHKDQVMLSRSLRIRTNKLKVYRCPRCKVQIIFEKELEGNKKKRLTLPFTVK